MDKKPSGPAAAAILSAGLGSFIFGLAVVLAVVSKDVKNFLEWCPPAGPLSGKAGMAVIVWLASWGVLHLIWRKREINLAPVLWIGFILILLGFLGSFPPFFEAFEHH